MGAPLAAALAKAGYLDAVWNRTRSRGERIAQNLGVFLAENPQQLAARCNVVLLSLARDADVLAIVAELSPALRADTIVIDTSTTGIDTARTAATTLAARASHFLDAPVSGGVAGARAGSLVAMVGGDAQVFARARPVFAAFSARAEWLGPAGSGQAAKAVNQLMVAGINQAVSEALAFGEALALPMAQVVDLLGGGAAANWFLAERGHAMLRSEFAAGFKIALHQKDLELCKAMAAAHGAQLPIVEMTLIHYKRLIAEGYGDSDTSALIQQKRRLFTEAK